VADLRGVLRSTDQAVKETKRLVSDVKGEAGELLKAITEVAIAAKSMIARAEKALASVDSLTGEKSEVRQQLGMMLQELTNASQSIRQLADYLERHPDALIKGKSGTR
jgi:paraquat-inducible protein B